MAAWYSIFSKVSIALIYYLMRLCVCVRCVLLSLDNALYASICHIDMNRRNNIVILLNRVYLDIMRLLLCPYIPKVLYRSTGTMKLG